MNVDVPMILVKTGSLAGKRFVVPPVPGAIELGRDPSCGIRFNPSQDRMVGRKHVQLEHRLDGIFLVDLNSRNGTFFRDRAIMTPLLLQQGDAFQLGEGGPICVLLLPTAREDATMAIAMDQVLAQQGPGSGVEPKPAVGRAVSTPEPSGANREHSAPAPRAAVQSNLADHTREPESAFLPPGIRGSIDGGKASGRSVPDGQSSSMSQRTDDAHGGLPRRAEARPETASFSPKIEGKTRKDSAVDARREPVEPPPRTQATNPTLPKRNRWVHPSLLRQGLLIVSMIFLGALVGLGLGVLSVDPPNTAEPETR